MQGSEGQGLEVFIPAQAASVSSGVSKSWFGLIQLSMHNTSREDICNVPEGLIPCQGESGPVQSCSAGARCPISNPETCKAETTTAADTTAAMSHEPRTHYS